MQSVGFGVGKFTITISTAVVFPLHVVAPLNMNSSLLGRGKYFLTMFTTNLGIRGDGVSNSVAKLYELGDGFAQVGFVQT